MEKKLEEYIKKFEKDYNFYFVKDIKLKEILYSFYGYVLFVYLEEIKYGNYSNELKELKAHTIFVYLGSIVEAIIFYFVKERLSDEKSRKKYLKMEEFQKLQKIMETKDLYICKLITREVSLNDSINFYALINGLKDRKLLSKNIIEKIDYCRKMRNLIHVSVMLTSEYKLIDELTKAFIYAKEIIDYVKIDLEKSQKVKD